MKSQTWKITIRVVAAFYLLTGLFLALGFVLLANMPHPWAWPAPRWSLIAFMFVDLLFIVTPLILFCRFSTFSLSLFSCCLAITVILKGIALSGIILLPSHITLCSTIDILLVLVVLMQVPRSVRFLSRKTSLYTALFHH